MEKSNNSGVGFRTAAWKVQHSSVVKSVWNFSLLVWLLVITVSLVLFWDLGQCSNPTLWEFIFWSIPSGSRLVGSNLLEFDFLGLAAALFVAADCRAVTEVEGWPLLEDEIMLRGPSVPSSRFETSFWSRNLI